MSRHRCENWRKGVRTLVFALAASHAAACATTSLERQYEPIPISILDVPALSSPTEHGCGATALAMLTAAAGRPQNVRSLLSLTMTPRKRGSLQLDLIAAARRLGHAPVQEWGESALRAAIRNGKPAVVLLDVSPLWWSQGHYVVVIGFDEARVALLDGGPTPTAVGWSRFRSQWRYSDRWLMFLQH